MIDTRLAHALDVYFALPTKIRQDESEQANRIVEAVCESAASTIETAYRRGYEHALADLRDVDHAGYFPDIGAWLDDVADWRGQRHCGQVAPPPVPSIWREGVR